MVGIGNKDGTYYVVDRDGINEATGVAWDDPDPSALPYWTTQVVPGGAIGGIIATAAVDEVARRVYFSTAPGEDVLAPQRPTVHALDLDTGAVVWQHDDPGFPAGDASYAPTSAVPGVVIVGSVITPHLRLFDAEDGALLYDEVIGEPGTFSGIASGAAVVDGTLVVGAGIGARSSGGSSPGDFAAETPSAVVALCVRGSSGCPGPPPRIVPGLAEIDETDGVATASIPVTLEFPSQSPVSAAWDVVAVGSLADDELPPQSGTVVFPPGATEADITVEVVGDTLHELDELGVVAVHDPVNAAIGGYWGLGFVRVLDDDVPPELRMRIGVAFEGDGPLRVPLRLDGPSGRDTSVAWSVTAATARPGDDYTTESGTTTIPAGGTRGEAVIELVDDRTREWPELLFVAVTAAEGASVVRATGAGIVLDDD